MIAVQMFSYIILCINCKYLGSKRPSNSYPNRSAAYENKHFKSDSINLPMPSKISSSFIQASSPCAGQTSKGTKLYEDTINQYGIDLQGLVLVEQLYVKSDGPIQILNRSFSMCHKQCSFNFEPSNDILLLWVQKLQWSCCMMNINFNFI